MRKLLLLLALALGCDSPSTTGSVTAKARVCIAAWQAICANEAECDTTPAASTTCEQLASFGATLEEKCADEAERVDYDACLVYVDAAPCPRDTLEGFNTFRAEEGRICQP